MKSILILLGSLPLFLPIQTNILDMSIHSDANSDFGEREPAACHYGIKGSINAEIYRMEILQY